MIRIKWISLRWIQIHIKYQWRIVEGIWAAVKVKMFIDVRDSSSTSSCIRDTRLGVEMNLKQFDSDDRLNSRNVFYEYSGNFGVKMRIKCSNYQKKVTTNNYLENALAPCTAPFEPQLSFSNSKKTWRHENAVQSRYDYATKKQSMFHPIVVEVNRL